MADDVVIPRNSRATPRLTRGLTDRYAPPTADHPPLPIAAVRRCCANPESLSELRETFCNKTRVIIHSINERAVRKTVNQQHLPVGEVKEACSVTECDRARRRCHFATGRHGVTFCQVEARSTKLAPA
jgi:hypothetical protein